MPSESLQAPAGGPARVLVTGAAGLLGRAVLARYAAAGVAVTALVEADPGDLPADRVAVGDARDPELVAEALRDVDAVAHLAAIPRPGGGVPDEHVFANNTAATFTVLDGAGRAGVHRAVTASSLAATGTSFGWEKAPPAYLPLDESVPLRPADPYALSKQTDEATAAMVARRYGMSVTALRFPHLAAPPESKEGLAAHYCVDPAVGAPHLWAYLHPDDAARACALALTVPGPGRHVAFLAAPRTYAAQPTEELLARYHPDVPRRALLPGRAVPIDTRHARELLGFEAELLWPEPEDL
ncbi:NAD-dependent epimerase/dehydratase family protein [Allonocardiopsis opalescens]|uniref:Nucleoside-diphosphate-sugar epimerase n=1 Tax=Allonocardiopsis opalescens TaxID=1144618 RepID=A0A2T0QE64_9ACTN|nr:NAD(P)-dependent oxidoreductase [Allonocardiopsis opalescens]PRY02236.1 nucleoside-diphosphate-sugar epimerase [Allonocardiopsis opalescens]